MNVFLSKLEAGFMSAALYWYYFGFNVIPVFGKVTAVTWDKWLARLTADKIHWYYTINPKHEVGFITGDDIIVFDADTRESMYALKRIELAFGVKPSLSVKTSRGFHHYFRRAPGTIAHSDGHSSDMHPSRIDVKTGRALVVLPPSSGKFISILEAENKNSLSEVSQDFIDEVFRHNGRIAPSIPRTQDIPVRLRDKCDEAWIRVLSALIEFIDTDCGYDDWCHVGMALFHETGGSDEGLMLFDNWSKNGATYPGFAKIQYKWRTFH